MNAKRGYVPEDERYFSAKALETLRTASRHISYLINEDYDLKQASVFVGNHFLLSERQRLAIMRSLATDYQLSLRKEKQVAYGMFFDKKGAPYGMPVSVLQPPEAVWGYETITSAYHEKPEESWQKIHNHMTALYPENRDRDIIKMIGKRPG